MDKLGVVHGRFQVLHNDHLKYILAGMDRCEHLIVGITNPDPTLTNPDYTNPARSLTSANPLSYYERYSIVKAALLEKGLGYQEFSVTPFPVNFPELYRYYVPMGAAFYITIYDNWGRRKHELLKGAGLRTAILWDRPPEQKGLSGAYVRDLMARGGGWESLVPECVARLLKEWGVPDRLGKIRQNQKTD